MHGYLSKVLVSSATLLLPPAEMDEVHTLEIEIVDGFQVIKEKIYTEDVKVTISLAGQAVEDRKLAINALLEKFYVDLDVIAIIPKLRDVTSSDDKGNTPI